MTMADEELFTVSTHVSLKAERQGVLKYVSSPMMLESAIKHLWEVAKQSTAGQLRAVSVKNRQGDVIYQEHARWTDWEHKELGEIWETSKYHGKDPRAIDIVRALTGKKPLRPRKKKAVKQEDTADVVSLPTSRVRWTLGEVAQGTAETEVVSISSARMAKKLATIAANMDQHGHGQLFALPMEDVTIGTDTPDAVCSDDPIMLGAQAFVAVKKLFLAFGIEAVPTTYGELKGGVAYCDALFRLGSQCIGDDADSKQYFECTLEVVIKYSQELVKPLTAYVQGDKEELRRLAGEMSLSLMASHYDVVEDCWMDYPLKNPLPMQAKAP